MLEEKVRHLETKARSFASQAAAIQATMMAAAELPEVVDMMNQLTTEQQASVSMAGLTPSQLEAVCTAVAAQQHLGIACDATQQQPIVGVRYTKPANGDTYDLCQAAFDALSPEKQEQFEAVPTPDINILIRAVSATQEAVPPMACEPEPESEDPSAPSPAAAPSVVGSASRQMCVTAKASSGRDIKVLSAPPALGERPFTDRKYTFTSMGSFAGTGMYFVQPPNDDKNTPSDSVMWTLTVDVPVTIYLDVWAYDRHYPSWP